MGLYSINTSSGRRYWNDMKEARKYALENFADKETVIFLDGKPIGTVLKINEVIYFASKKERAYIPINPDGSLKNLDQTTKTDWLPGMVPKFYMDYNPFMTLIAARIAFINADRITKESRKMTCSGQYICLDKECKDCLE